ncbi:MULTISPECIES: class I SAM-dependent methyltransferase [unclassified Moorena]|uniref:class I SAM-dependent methyltransferase n=1 Tax=unclassified Moorena TaxID=2683338 RepID=UPI0013FE7D15|nr:MULTISPECIES: class I SAM-dependent methyltransferase [unclassified Moorena]NEO13852.1 class I SAM-dependent methyltransferase [Moorena sp. SIO3E8]NEQ00298.1 class I SAM-dependent methyltransferase [Moorena sp. SIO3F7]
MKKNKYCMNCKSSKLEQFIDLGKQPNGNTFPALNEIDNEQNFPFAMSVCTQCWQVQLEEFPPVEYMFTNHPYVTGLNQPVVHHFEELVDNTLQKFDIPPNSLVLDIGANDGTLLSKFRDRGLRVLGIDPCKGSSELSRQAGITVLEAFWNRQTAEAMKRLGIYPDLITATAVFYHVEDLHSFVQGLEILMEENTIFCTQCVYLKDVIEKKQFDHFYHEHTMIHGIAPLRDLFSRYGLRLLDVDFYPIHGGSFVLYVGRKKSPFPTTKKIDDAISEEKRFGLDRLQTYLDFSKGVEQNKEELVSLLQQIRGAGKRVFGLGAPLKGSTLLNYCGIGPDLVECAVEINQYKIGRYTPGTHIPIVCESLINEQPDYYLVLAWNFLDFFIKKYADYLNAGGKFIIPHPTVTILEQEWVVSNCKSA